jgi:adenosylcobinamide-phosphate synthase
LPRCGKVSAKGIKMCHCFSVAYFPCHYPMLLISPVLPLALIAGVCLDRLLGEPRRWHPLVGFGALANRVEQGLRSGAPGHAVFNRVRGLLGWLLLVLPCVALFVGLRFALLAQVGAWAWLLDTLLLYFALGTRSLVQHGERVAQDLAAQDLPAARTHVGWMVSRDTSTLDEQGVFRAAVESILENGNDAVFGTLFWFCVAGGAGAVLFRLANTLDAMWGYKDTRRIYFGWAAARIDDGLNFIPARLTALTYALLGKTRTALHCWRYQAKAWDSPNAGPVLAAGAGAMGVQLGGAAMYHGQLEMRPKVGPGDGPKEVQGAACPAGIRRALALVACGQRLWVAVVGGLGLFSFLLSHGKLAFV